MKNSRKGFAFLLSCVWVALCTAAASQEPPVDLLAKTHLGGGLVVHVGATDGRIETRLAEQGVYLVHGLALDDEACGRRAGIAAEGLYGLAAVAVWSDRRRLPYAANLTAAVICDVDGLGAAAPGNSELTRIVAPEGALLLKTGGRWQVTRKPRPAAMDDWGHFDHGADGNPVSQDLLVAPVRQQQWITGVQPNPFEGNPAGYAPGAGIRLWKRYAVVDVNDAYSAKGPNDRDTWVLQGRDAFSGIPLWTVPRDREVAQRRWSLVAAEGEVYAWLKRDGRLAALDIATGEPNASIPAQGTPRTGCAKRRLVCELLATTWWSGCASGSPASIAFPASNGGA